MNNQFQGIDSGKAYLVEKELGQGGQGIVYLVTDNADKTKYAAKWYRSKESYQQILNLVKRGVPKIDDPGIHFIWPIECLKFADLEGFGYLMPLIDTNRFFSPNQIILGQAKQPKLPTLCSISYRLATALDTLHSAGLAYCDINQGNIMFDPTQGEVVICDNDNVVINNGNTPVRGVWEFMAPEVALGQSKPNAESDLYSVAVLLYYLWIWEHPMEGKETLQQYCWDIPNKKKHFAENPIFMFHPTNPINTALDVPELKLHVERWFRMCPPKLRTMFTKTFSEHVHKPSQRVRIPDWQRVFLELGANSPTCTCGAVNLWDGDNKPLECWKCQKEIPLRLSLRVRHNHFGDSFLYAYPGAYLRQHHLDVTHFNVESSKPVGRVEAHPQAMGHVILRNLSDTPWGYKTPDGQSLSIEPIQARALMPNIELSVGNHIIQVQEI